MWWIEEKYHICIQVESERAAGSRSRVVGRTTCDTVHGKNKATTAVEPISIAFYTYLHHTATPLPHFAGPTRTNTVCPQILAFRRAYFKDPWNRFDFFIVLGSMLGLLTRWFLGTTYGSIATIIRIFRIGRVFRLVRGMEAMAQLFWTLLMTLPSLGNVGALLFLLFFIYAAMGVQLYAKVSGTGLCQMGGWMDGSVRAFVL